MMSNTFNPQFQRIGEILIHLGKISESQLQEALLEQKNTKEKLGSPSKRCPDIRKISKLGFKPQINLDVGLKKTFEWYRKELINVL